MRKILIIEDNEDVRENTADLLELSHYTVQTSADGASGIEKAKHFSPDLIICDIMMPGIDGYQVLEALQGDSKTAGIPFIFLSAKADKTDIRKGMNLGADDYLTKPFEEHELLEAIRSRLKRHDFLHKEFSRDISGLHAFLEEAAAFLNLDYIERKYFSKNYAHKELLFTEGNGANFLYYIKKGLVKTFKSTEGGKELITGISQEGNFVGALSLLNPRSTYLESALILEDSEIYRIPKSDFIHLLEENKEVSKKFIALISTDLIDAQEQLVNLAYSPVRQRLALMLIKLQRAGLIQDANHEGIDIAREDLAGMVGTATETVIRALSDLKDKGVIRIGKARRILIADPTQLRAIANFG
ncbi:response regulator [Robiginitalea aurantiaca]|uniref:Response regulator n=1 Tax=Robiginitalea aurantiaca TaxID=3056915 RepID=A0ABT7WH79_9FLAO|nr:response regulator [Robiginitalea aurantiaca]MDM9632282.1 response regulator [Robiginitalea aurantiaca]